MTLLVFVLLSKQTQRFESFNMSPLFIPIGVTTVGNVVWPFQYTANTCILGIPHAWSRLNYGSMPGILASIHGIGLQWQKEIFTSFRNNSRKNSVWDQGMMNVSQWGKQQRGLFLSLWVKLTSDNISECWQQHCHWHVKYELNITWFLKSKHWTICRLCRWENICLYVAFSVNIW